MNRVDELLHETLGAEPASQTGMPPWDQVTRRGDELVRRRRIRWTTLAIGVVVVLVAAGSALARRGEGDASRSIVATPPSSGSTIVAAIDGKIVTMDSSDGHIIEHLVDAPAPGAGSGLVSGVAVSPDAKTLYYTRTSTQDPCGRTVIVEHSTATGAEHDLVAGFYPVVSPDGRWLAYTTVECGDSRDFLAITALAPRAHYRPYEQLLGDEPSKVQPLAWSPADQLLWNRFHQGPPDQQTFDLISPPLDHGNAPTALDTQHSVAAAAYVANGELVVAQGTTDHWQLDILNPDGSTSATRAQSTGAMPMTMSAAPTGDAVLLTMPDGQLLIQKGNSPPQAIATGVQSAAWMPANTTNDDVSAQDMLGLQTTLPAGWNVHAGTCPESHAIVVNSTSAPAPVPDGCPPINGVWITIQRIPHDLQGIDKACGPGYIGDSGEMLFCQTFTPNPPGDPATLGIERRFYGGLDVLVSVHHTAGDDGVEPELTYAHPDQVRAGQNTTTQLPQPTPVAQDAITTAMQKGCDSLANVATATVVDQCKALDLPSDGTVTGAAIVSVGGSVPALYVDVAVRSATGSENYRLLVQNEWDTNKQRSIVRITDLRLYSGADPMQNTACVAQPIDAGGVAAQGPKCPSP